MMKENNTTVEKQPYRQPRLRTIDLVAEEVLAIGCKNVGTSAPGSPRNCMSNQCSGNNQS